MNDIIFVNGAPTGIEKAAEDAAKSIKKQALNELLRRHDKGREKISSQCNTLISKRLVEEMIEELE